MAKTWARFCAQISSQMDQCANSLLHAEKMQMGRKPHASLSKTKLSTPEDEIRKLVISATSLGDIWQFFLKRLKNGSSLDFLCFSILDEPGEFIEARFIYSDEDIE